MAYSHLTMAYSKGRVHGHTNFETNILEITTDGVKIILAIKQRVMYVGLRLAYAHLTLAHSDGQGQSHFDNNYLGDNDIYSVTINITIKQQVMYAFSIGLFIFGLDLPKVKVKVKVVDISPMNISEMVMVKAINYYCHQIASHSIELWWKIALYMLACVGYQRLANASFLFSVLLIFAQRIFEK